MLLFMKCIDNKWGRKCRNKLPANCIKTGQLLYQKGHVLLHYHY
jgi:hypothetical protein